MIPRVILANVLRAAKYFKNYKLDYPNAETNKASKKYVKAMKKLPVRPVPFHTWLPLTAYRKPYPDTPISTGNSSTSFGASLSTILRSA